MKKKIIVLYSHNPSRLAHLNKLNSLRNKYEITLVMDKKDNLKWQSKFVDKVIEINMEDSLKYKENLFKELGEIDGVLNLSELCVPLGAQISDYYSLPGIKSDMVISSRNKYKMRDLASNLGIPIPKYYLFNENNKEEISKLEYPLIVKPLIGGGSGLIKKVHNYIELESGIKKMSTLGEAYKKDPLFLSHSQENKLNFIVEEVIGGEVTYNSKLPYEIGEISVESIYYNGQCKILAIHDKNLPKNGPYFEEHMWSTPTRIPSFLIEKALEYVKKIHKTTNSYILHTEFRTIGKQLILLEFGARMGGGPIYSSILASTGIDLIEVLIEISLRKKPNLNEKFKYPTITHCIWARNPGEIVEIKGLSSAVMNPFYDTLQIYDDIGDMVFRAPKSTRANGHIRFVNNLDNNFENLEKSVLTSIEKIKIDTKY